jgi:outer membrane protein OmpA-like peptidoglycan-associated protein
VQTAEGKVLADAVTTVGGAQSGLQGTGFWIVELHEGAYTVQGFAQGYIPATTRFEIPYEQERVVLVLQPAAVTGTLTLRIRDAKGKPVDASWTIDGRPGAPTTNGGVVARLAPGVHDLVVTHPGYATVRQSTEVPAKGNVDALVRLEPARVSVTETQIDVQGTVYFDTGSARILPTSFSLLDEVAQVMTDHPELLRVRVEGHTDSRGSASSNRVLSEARAASVATYLVERGVDRGRLVSVGYGEDKPLLQEENAAAWEKNRRVDFFVEARQ